MTRSHAVVLSLALFFAAAPALCQTTTVSVNSAVVTNATGVSVTSGQQLTITANGIVNIADRDGPYDANPDGTITTAPPNPSGAYTYFTNNAGPVGTPPAVGNKKTILSGGQLNNQPYAALVAGFSSSPTGSVSNYVLVGSSATITAPITGYLFLAVNDVNNTYDNNGSFSATITTTGQPIAAVEFTQAIQQYQSLSDLKAYLGAHNQPPVPIIADKPAVMRIYYNPPTEFNAYKLTVTGAASDSESFAMLPGCPPLAQRARTAPCYATDVFFTPPSGTWSVNIVLTDTLGNQIENETLSVTSVTPATMNLAAVQVCNRLVGHVLISLDPACGDPTQLEALTGELATIMPTSSLKVTQTGSVASFLKNQFSGEGDDPALWDLGVALNLAYDYFLPAEWASGASFNQYTTYVGVGPGGSSSNYPGSAVAFTDGPIGSSLVNQYGHGAVEIDVPFMLGGVDLTQSNLDRTVPAAVGYLSGTNIDPPPADSPHPYSAPGCWGPNGGGQFSNTWPFTTNRVQSANGLEYGYDVPNLTVIDPNAGWDIETYCDPTWISPIDYTNILNTLLGGTPNYIFNPPALASRSRGPVGPASEVRAKAQPEALPPVTLTLGTYLQVSGFIGATSASLNPIFSQTMYGRTDPGAGTYSIVEQGSTGQALYTRNFTPGQSFDDSFDGTTSTTVQGPGGFAEWMPQTPGTTNIAVFDPNGNSLASVAITGTAPTVSITAPAAGFTGSGPQDISWTAQENGVTSFYSRVYYSIDQGNTWTLIGNTTLFDQAFDFGTLPGSSSALIRVDVSDGVNTGSATSVPFSVPKKNPSTIMITSPASGAIRLASKPVYLVGAAYDPDDGSLTGTALAWSDNVQGNLGTGSPIAVNLQPGPHTITLTATDSDGNAISTTTSITVAGAAPAVTVTTNTLSTNCVSATIGATPGNQGLGLSTVAYSLDGGTTYTSVPLSALPYSFVVPGSSPVNVFAYATDTAGQIGAQSAPVSLSGSCAAGIPFVSAGTPQTAPIGSSFSTPLSVHISDASGNPVSGVVVNFAAPASGASAKLSASSATTGANGVASVTATANSTSGAYQVVASVAGFSTTAQFNLTNTDFTLGVLNSSLTVHHGYAAFNTISVTPLLGFNSPVTLGCSGLPKGVTCTFSSPTVTPSGSTVYSSLTINAAGGASQSSATTLSALTGGVVVAFCLLVPGLRRRRKIFTAFLMIVLALVLGGVTSCAKFNAFSSTVTVTATSGALQHSGAIDLSVQ
jgi:5-hydroxyisourate hydrolase-like protein (transthyretin family)